MIEAIRIEQSQINRLRDFDNEVLSRIGIIPETRNDELSDHYVWLNTSDQKTKKKIEKIMGISNPIWIDIKEIGNEKDTIS